jgi:SEC-C motif
MKRLGQYWMEINTLDYIDTHWPHFRDVVFKQWADFVGKVDIQANSDDFLPIYFAALLAHHRDSECFELAQQLALLSDAQLEDAFGESYVENVPGWFAAWCHQSAERLQWLRNGSSGVSQQPWHMRYVCLSALAVCAAENVIGLDVFAEDATQFCQALIQEMKRGVWSDPADPEDFFCADEYVAMAVCDWMDICFTQPHLEKVQPWFEQGYAHEGMVDWNTVQRHVQVNEPERIQSNPHLPAYPTPEAKGFPKTVFEEIGWWACFHEDYQPDVGDDLPWDTAEHHGDLYPQQGYGLPPSLPFVRTEPKLGRNDPCICGSSKKYKKCCGA